MTTPTIPNYEPGEITRGATVAWTRSLLDYRASDGWALTTYFRGQGPGVDVVATANGSGFSSEMTAAQSATLAPGRYDWQAWVSKDDERHMIGNGSVRVSAGFAAIGIDTAVDGRTENEVMLANVRLALGKAGAKNVASYTIANRMKSEHSIADLLLLESRLVQLVNQERQAAALKRGAPFLQNVYTRFK